MKVETALTAFSMTTLLLIVGLVAMTASELGITNPSLVGNFYRGGSENVAGSALQLTIVKVDPASSQCYQNGVVDCQRMNSGENFRMCVESVTKDCGGATPLVSNCFLPKGFEMKYNSNRECSYGVMNECKAMCSVGMQDDCVRMSKARCSIIGGKFQADYTQDKYRTYGAAESSVMVS